MRRIPAAARWCALVAFANALVWSLVTPPFHVPDETVHVAYLQQLAETGRIPNKPGASVFSAEEAAVLDALRFNSVVGSARDRPVYTEAQQRAIRTANEADRSRVSGGGTAESSSQPPLFYAYESIGYLASPWRGLLERVWLMRLMSALLCAATVLFVYLFLRELVPSEPWAWTVGALAVAFQPLFGFTGSGVTPDTLFFAASAALFWALARAFRQGLTPERGAVIGAALAVGLLAKLNFIALLPGVLLGVALLVWRERRGRSLRPARLGAAAACAIPGAVAVVYVALNELVWDRTAWGGGVGIAARTAAGTGSHASDAITLADQLSYTWQLYLPRLPGMDSEFFHFPGWETWYRGFIGEFGWLDTTFDLWVYRVSLRGHDPAGAPRRRRADPPPGGAAPPAGGDPHVRRARVRDPRVDRRARDSLPPKHRVRVRAGALPASVPAALRRRRGHGRDRRGAPLRQARRRAARGACRGTRAVRPAAGDLPLLRLTGK